MLVKNWMNKMLLTLERIALAAIGFFLFKRFEIGPVKTFMMGWLLSPSSTTIAAGSYAAVTGFTILGHAFVSRAFSPTIKGFGLIATGYLMLNYYNWLPFEGLIDGQLRFLNNRYLSGNIIMALAKHV